MDGVDSQGGMTRFPPGKPAPTVAERMAAGRAAWNALPKEERRARRDAKKAERAAKEQAKADKKTAREAATPPSSVESPPDTVRSHRSDPPVRESRETIASPPPSFRSPGGPMKGLLDLVANMPSLGDGTVFIQVTRVKPTTAFNVACAGVQRSIYAPLDDAEFQMMYGGAEYSLRGYKYREQDGRAVPITDPVPYKVPGPPNLESAQLPTEEETAMQPNGSPFQRPPRRPLTPQQASAEADMHDRNLTHAETMDERKARRAAELEERRRREDADQKRLELEKERLAMEQRDREAERLDEAHKREVELLQSRGSGVQEIAELLRVMKPDDGGRAAQAHAAEIRQLAEGHKSEMLRLTEQHREEIARLLQTHQSSLQRVEDQARSDRERADTLVREEVRRSQDTVRQIQADADRRVQDIQVSARSQYDDLRTRGEERLRDQNEQWQRRFDDLKESQSRELRAKDSEINLMRSNLEGSSQVMLAAKDQEIKRLSSEIRQKQDEITKAGDWVAQMQKAEEAAKMLGYQKNEPGEGGEGAEEDMKSFAVKAGIQALTRLPEMIQAGANAVTQLRGGGAGAPAAMAPRQPGIRSNMRSVQRNVHQLPAALPFATEDGPAYQPPPGAALPYQPSLGPVLQTIQPPPASAAPPAQEQVMGVPQAAQHEPVPALPQPLPQAQVMSMPPQPARPIMPPPTPMAPPQPSVPPPSMALPPSVGVMAHLDEQGVTILNALAPDLTTGFTEHVPPQAVAHQLSQQVPMEVIKMALSQVQVQQIIGHVTSNSGSYPQLSSRSGQKYLREVWRAIQQIAEANP